MMSEKRFTNVGGVEEFVHTIFDNDSAKTLSMKQVVDLLNSLYKENEQLRKDCTILVQSNQEYRKKNEQLKEQNRKLYKLALNCKTIGDSDE